MGMVAIPAVVTLVLTALSAAPVVVMGGVAPMGFFACVIAFALTGGRGMPAWLVGVLSLVADTMLGVPLGAHGVVAMVLLMLARRYGRVVARQQMLTEWVAMVAALLLAQGMLCAVLWLFDHPVGMASAGASWLLTLPLVPLLWWGAERVSGE
jgi:hypothetical protein